MYSALIKNLSVRLNGALPSALAHEPMRAVPVGDLRPMFDHDVPPRLGSVLILLYEEGGKIKFPLIKRPDYVGAHGGQISLPGGKREEGENPIQTALREAEEEIGIDIKAISILGRLSEFFVIPSNFLVTPVVASMQEVPVFKADAYEVAKIIYGNIEDLVKEDAVITAEILAAGKYTMRAPHFIIEDEIVWGATAMILNELRYVLREVINI